MRKIWIAVISVSLCLTLFGCGDSDGNTNHTKNPTAGTATPGSSATRTPENTGEPEITSTVTEDAFTITLLSATEEAFTGNRDENNLPKENGEYFMLGSELKKVADYKKYVIRFKMENKGDKAVGYSKNAWNFKNQDGKELKYIVGAEELLLKQIPAKDAKEDQLDVYAAKGDTVHVVKADYSYMDYDQNYWDDFKQWVAGDLSKEEYENKYTPKDLKVAVKADNADA